VRARSAAVQIETSHPVPAQHRSIRTAARDTWAARMDTAPVKRRDPKAGTAKPRLHPRNRHIRHHDSIRKILDHLGLGTPPQDKAPPVREILRVAEDGEGWEVPGEWA
jgi:hypothetical protein